jgi:hypothetical protein
VVDIASRDAPWPHGAALPNEVSRAISRKTIGLPRRPIEGGLDTGVPAGLKGGPGTGFVEQCVVHAVNRLRSQAGQLIPSLVA